MEGQPNSRLFYRKTPEEVVVQRNGLEIARYRNTKELVEVHMKGMIAIDSHTADHVLRIYRGGNNGN